MLNSPNKNFLLSRSFLNFLMIFRKLKEQFLRVWENFAPPPRIRPSFLLRGQGIRQKIAWVAGIRSLKKILLGVARGGGGCTQLELTETLWRVQVAHIAWIYLFWWIRLIHQQFVANCSSLGRCSSAHFPGYFSCVLHMMGSV